MNTLDGWELWDAHTECYGYVSSPADGAPYDPLARLLALNAEAGVRGCRMFGVAAEHLYRLGPPRNTTVLLAPVGSYLDGYQDGFRATRVCERTEAIDRAVAALAADGYPWICLGQGLPGPLAAHAAAAAGFAVAVEGGTPVEPSTADSVEGLLGIAAGPVPRKQPLWRTVAGLSTVDITVLHDRLQPWVSARVPIVPMLLRLRRACVLEDAIGASRLEELAEVLPYHRYLAQLRNPAALRFGRRHVTKHLGYHRFERDERREFEAGWDVLTGLLCHLAEAGAVLAGGSGAPATGMCPGYSLREEARLWLAVGVAADVARHAFGPAAQALVTSKELVLWASR